MLGPVLNTLSPLVRAICLFTLLGITIGALVNLQMQKNKREKKEALFITVSLSIIFIMLNAFSDVIRVFTETSENVNFSALDVTLFIVVVYFATYIYLCNAKKKGTGAYYFKLYSNLEDLEIWLNEQSREGCVCVKCYPSLYVFKMEYREQSNITFKTEYASTTAKEFGAYIEKNEKNGWKSVLASGNKYDGSNVGIAVFSTSAENPDMGAKDRHRIYKLEKKLTGTILANICISIAFILINIFVLTNEPAIQLLTIFVVGICCIQVGLRIYSTLSKREEYKIMK